RSEVGRRGNDRVASRKSARRDPGFGAESARSVRRHETNRSGMVFDRELHLTSCNRSFCYISSARLAPPGPWPITITRGKRMGSTTLPPELEALLAERDRRPERWARTIDRLIGEDAPPPEPKPRPRHLRLVHSSKREGA